MVSSPSVSINGFKNRALRLTGLCLATQDVFVFSVIFSQRLFDCMKQSLHVSDFQTLFCNHDVHDFL